jgi:protein disulfide-isomerase A1
MSKWQFFALLLGVLLLTAPLIRAEEDDYEDEGDEAEKPSDDDPDVVVVTADNFEDKVKKAKFALVEFYAPWCGHCQKLKPEYSKAATALKAHDETIVLGKVDATKESDLAQKHGVSGYPTIKWFVDGEVAMDYSGPRDADGIVRWVKKKTGPAAVTLASKDDLTEQEKGAEVVVVGYFKELKGADFDAFTKVAQASEDATFLQTTDAATAKAAGLSSAGVAVVTNFPGEERGAVTLKGKVTEDSIKDLIKSEKMPPTIEFNDGNSQKIFGAGIEMQLLLLAKATDLKSDAKLFKAYRETALANKGKLVFVTVDMDGGSKEPVANFFSVKDDDVPVILGFNMPSNKKYKLKGDLTEKNIKKFATDLLAGKLEPEYKSAPIPDEPKDGGVTVVVGKNFDEIVKDAKKDVLLEVYAPWCGHCKQLDPIYKKLAKRFEKVDSVVIAKMDGTENEHADVDVKGFPTIMLFPAEKDAKPISFDGGDRSLKALTKFLKKSAKISFELPKKKGGKEEDKEEEETKDEL